RAAARRRAAATTRAAGKRPAGARRDAAPKRRAARLSRRAAMKALEGAGTEQPRKIYRRHGARDPLFGVSFAVMKVLVKQIGVDHELAVKLWETGNHDAQTLAVKIADPTRMGPADLDHWAGRGEGGSCGSYVAMLTCEGP